MINFLIHRLTIISLRTSVFIFVLLFSLILLASNTSGITNLISSLNPIGPEAMDLPRNWAVTGKTGMVATANAHATKAGIHILKKGGNAIDAALAIQWVLNVVEPQSSGIGGGGFLLYFDAKEKKVFAIDGREESPKGLAIEDFYGASGKLLPFYPFRISSPSSVGVPGIVSMLSQAQNKLGSGKITFKETFTDAIFLAEKGFRVSKRLAKALQINKFRIFLRNKNNIPKHLYPEGKPLSKGRWLKQKDLANTFQRLARKGAKDFYEGKIAGAIVQTLKSISPKSKLSKNDLRRYVALFRKPVSAKIYEHEVYTMPPPSSGAILLQSLLIRENFLKRISKGLNDLNKKSAKLNSFSREMVSYDLLSLNLPSGLHLKLEAEKLAFADREMYIADPDFIFHKNKMNKQSYVKGLLEPNYINKRSKLINLKTTLKTPTSHGILQNSHLKYPKNPQTSSEQTTHFVVVDAKGNVVSMTSSIEHSFGSGIMVQGRGFFLNNQLTDFTFDANSINAPQGQLVARPNVLNKEGQRAGGKRPRSSMSPTIILKNGKFVLAIGSPGGTFIPGSISSVLINIFEKKMDIQSAVNEPRMLHRNGKTANAEWPYWQSTWLMDELKKRGHRFAKPTMRNHAMGGVQAIYQDPKTKILWGAADTRREGIAIAIDEISVK